jgi:hypothetical protein
VVLKVNRRSVQWWMERTVSSLNALMLDFRYTVSKWMCYPLWYCGAFGPR